MLESTRIARRQSEIRQELASLVGKETPSEDELRSMEQLDKEFQQNETRYRGALIAEDNERREAGEELETAESRDWQGLLEGFEVRQVVAALDHGHQLTGQTAAVVAEMRGQGTYTGIPLPLEGGAVVGAIGVSGSTVDNDQAVAEAGARAFQEALTS